jgi:hypothetical protein
MQFPQSQCCNNSYLPPYNGSYSGCGNDYPIVPGTNPALQTWNGQNFVVADGSAQNRISLPFLQVNSGGATYVIGADNNGTLSYYNPAFGGNATNLVGGVTGSLPYQLALNTTTFLPIGTVGQVLKVNSSGLPEWSTPLAPNAQNILGGSAGSVVYQTATNATGFTAVGINGQVLTSGGGGSPTWTNQSALSVGNATNATNATTASVATNIYDGTAGSIHYQTAPSTTTSLAIGTQNQILTVNSGGTAPAWKTGITGVTNGSDASAGIVGEYISSQVTTGVSITQNVVTNITSISLTAGDWDVSSNLNITCTITNNITFTLQGGISTTSATLGSQDTYSQIMIHAGASATQTQIFASPIVRLSLTSTTTVYLVGFGNGSLSSITGKGTIRARRIR